MDLQTIFVTAAVGVGATGITAAGGLLINVAIKVARIEEKLDGHIEGEDKDKEEVNSRLEAIEMKLPNGEVEQTWQMVSELYQKLLDDRKEN